MWDGLGATVDARLAEEGRTVTELSGTADADEGLAAVIEKPPTEVHGALTVDRFAGRTALVTGGARGIGGAISARLAAEGADVFVGDLDLDAATALAAEIGARAVRLDVADPASARAAVEAARRDARRPRQQRGHRRPPLVHRLEPRSAGAG